jgi:hypothetical protein
MSSYEKKEMTYLDRDTYTRYVKGLTRTKDPAYIDLEGHIEKVLPENADAGSWSPVIIPENEIKNYDLFNFWDCEFLVIRGAEIPGLQRDQMIMVFDFLFGSEKHALSFGFFYQWDVDWLRFLLKVNRLTILRGPQGPVGTPIALELEKNRLKYVEQWLDSFK